MGEQSIKLSAGINWISMALPFNYDSRDGSKLAQLTMTHLFKGRDGLAHAVHAGDEGAGDGALVVGRALLQDLGDSN